MEEKVPKKRRGKPQDYSKLKRNSQVKIRLTEEEVRRLKAAAADADMSMADYIMAGIDQSRRIVVTGAPELRKEVFRVGKNLNQSLMLAYTARKEGQPVDLQNLEKAAAKAEDVLEQLVELLIKWDAVLEKEIKK